MIKILVVDTERSIRNTLKERLEYEGYRVETTDNVLEGVALHDKKPYDIVLCSHDQYAVDDPMGIDTIKGSVPVIVLAEDDNVAAVIETVRSGAFDYFTKPIDMNRLRESLKKARQDNLTRHAHAGANAVPKHPPLHARGNVIELVGDSEVIGRVKRLIDKVGPSDARVLITGANGSGKELVARSIHEKSARRRGPFVEINCAAIPSELIESELFGHEKGAFTSAVKQRKGKFEQANGGTIFLDEIGDMSLSAQSKVLRALQERRITRVGGESDMTVDVRILAATNKDLRREILKGTFREDLYHRLSVIIITLPTLAERREDIPGLTRFFLEKVCGEYEMECKHISDEAMDALAALDWSGNVRELRNVVERLIVLSENSITLDDVKAYVHGC